MKFRYHDRLCVAVYDFEAQIMLSLASSLDSQQVYGQNSTILVNFKSNVSFN